MSDADSDGRSGENRGVELGGASLNAILDVLADDKCRYALHYLKNKTDNVASVNDLDDYILTHDPEANDQEYVRVDLHHRVLPKLDGADLIDYDPRSETVRYYGDSTTEDLLEHLSGVQ